MARRRQGARNSPAPSISTTSRATTRSSCTSTSRPRASRSTPRSSKARTAHRPTTDAQRGVLLSLAARHVRRTPDGRHGCVRSGAAAVWDLKGMIDTSTHSFEHAIAGCHIRSLFVEEFWYRGELAAPVSVVFAQIAEDRWLRFFFDAGEFFWSEESSPSLPPTTDDFSWRLTEVKFSGLVHEATLLASHNCDEPSVLTVRSTSGEFLSLHNQFDGCRLEFGE